MKEYFKKKIPEIEKEIKQFFPENIDNDWIKDNVGNFSYKFDLEVWNKAISEPFYSLFNRGGKRIRPVLCCLMHDAMKGSFKEIYKFSIISEIIHTGTLIIDDIEDNSDMRRGGGTVHKMYGPEIALNSGVFIHFLPQLIIKNSSLSYFQKSALYDVVSSELTKVHLGQGMDILWSKEKRIDVSIDEYLQMAAYKTSALLNVALKVGAILSEVDEKEFGKIDKISEKMGIAFQIKDDILNLKPGKEWGKETGEDIAEGKITYILCNTIASASSKDREAIESILSSKTKDKKEIEKIIKIFEKYGSFDSAYKYAEKLIFSAKNDIDDMLEDSDYKQIFLEILDYVILRNK